MSQQLLWGRQHVGDTDEDDGYQHRLGLWSLPTEVVVHALSFVANPRDLCSVSLTCQALAAISRVDALWKPLGHPSWADRHVKEEGGWKAAYMKWLRAAITLYRKRPAALMPRGEAPERCCTPTNRDEDIATVVLGLPGVGKMSILRRHKQITLADSPPTATTTTRGGGGWVDLDIRLARTRFSSANLSFCKAAKGVLVVYDITDLPSFDATTQFLRDIRKYASEDVSVVMAGNKTDLAPENRVVTEQMGRRRAREWDVLFCECSATMDEGLDPYLLLVAAMQTSWQRPAGMAPPYHVPSEALAQLFPPPRTDVAQPSSTEAKQQWWCVLQ